MEVNDDEFRLTLDEMAEVLRHWEALDDVPWDDATRMECAEIVSVWPNTVAQWKHLIVKLPDGLEDRYRKLLQLLVDKGLIDEKTREAELESMRTLSPGSLVRNGKLLADWLRSTH